MKKGKIIPLASVTCILDQFEAKALQSIKIDATIKCDNYESVGRLILVKNIRKAIDANIIPITNKPNRKRSKSL
jgi:hypothetical protein